MSKTRAKKADKLEPKYRLKQLPDGSTVQSFQRGLHEVVIGSAGKHTPESRWRREIMLARANELLAQHGVPSFQSIVASGDGNMEKTDILINAWIKSIGVQPQLGLFAGGPFVAASFLALDHLVCSDVVTRVRSTMNLASPEPSEAELDVIHRQSEVQVRRIREYANAWHWWHMEVFGEHVRAYEGQKGRNSRAKAGPARSARALQRLNFIELFCEDYLKRHPGHSAARTADALLADGININAALRNAGYKLLKVTNNRSETLEKMIRKIKRRKSETRAQ